MVGDGHLSGFKIGRSEVLGTSIAGYTSLSEAPGKIIGVSGEIIVESSSLLEAVGMVGDGHLSRV